MKNGKATTEKPMARGEPVRKVRLELPVGVLDRFIRASHEISAELPALNLSVESLLSFCLSRVQADEMIVDFVTASSPVLSAVVSIKEIMGRDGRRIELEPVGEAVASGARREDARLGGRISSGKPAARNRGDEPKLSAFIRRNPEVHRQVESSSKAVLVRWVMLHLMERTQARERGRGVVRRFLLEHPAFNKRAVGPAGRRIRQGLASGSRSSDVG